MDSATSDKNSLANELWQFALAFWQLPGIEDTCLTLQQRGWSVTRILCAGWLATQERSYDGTEPDELSQWRRNKTEAIRALRQSIGKQEQAPATLRGLLAKAELESEKIELDLAWAWLQHQPTHSTVKEPPMTLAQANVRVAAPPDEDTDSADIHQKIIFLAQQVFKVFPND
ncbi:TIGR02444 family protein [uncultured Marinobacter sp.]|uniref:TIGR02444 family protein n=1 Tax=uncultured Marinobacter sp. TaxID=187379 RepID=UPI0030DD5D0C